MNTDLIGASGNVRIASVFHGELRRFAYVSLNSCRSQSEEKRPRKALSAILCSSFDVKIASSSDKTAAQLLGSESLPVFLLLLLLLRKKNLGNPAACKVTAHPNTLKAPTFKVPKLNQLNAQLQHCTTLNNSNPNSVPHLSPLRSGGRGLI